MKGRVVVALACGLLLSGCSTSESPRSTSESSAYIHARDEQAMLREIAADTSRVLRQVQGQLSDYLKARAARDSLQADSLQAQLTWLVPRFTQATGVVHPSRTWERFQFWSDSQAAKRVALDSLFATSVGSYRKQKSLDPDGAFAVYGDALDTLFEGYDALADSAGMASAYYYMARRYHDRGEVAQAEQYLEYSSDLARRLELWTRLGDCQLLLATIRGAGGGDLYAAEVHLAAAHDSYGRVGNRSRLADVEIWRARNHFQLSLPRRAISLARRAADIDRTTGRRSHEAYCLYFMGECYVDLEQYDSAYYYADQSRDLRERIVESLRDRGGEVPARYSADLDHSLSLMGVIAHQNGHLEQAEQTLREAARGFAQQADTAGMILNRGRLAWVMLDAGAHQQAKVLFWQNLSLATQFEDGFDAVVGIAAAGYRAEEFEEAKTLLWSAIERVETSRAGVRQHDMRAGLLANKVRAYNLLAAVYAELFRRAGDPVYIDSSLISVELVRSRSLRDMMRERTWADVSPDMERLIEERSNIAAARMMHSRDSAGLSARLAQIDDSLYRLRLSEAPATAGRGATSGLDSTLLRHVTVPPRTALLVYELSPFACFSFVFLDDGVHLVEIDAEYDSLRRLAREYVEAISVPPHASDLDSGLTETGGRLFRLLIPDLVANDTTIDRLVVIPTDILHYLPLETLVDEQGRYLAERFSTSYAPALHFDRESRPWSGKERRWDVVAFGDPILPATGTFSSLDYAAHELDAIESVYARGRVRIFRGSEATEANFKNFDFRNTSLVHVASHGFCDLDEPANSALLFTSDTVHDAIGMLHPDEIHRLVVPTELVFLSTCQSGTGRLLRGEGLLGLARPFLLAGSRAAIVTLWNVDDRSAARFVADFYARLHASESPEAALRAARQSLITSTVPLYRHPYFWAPYVMFGMW